MEDEKIKNIIIKPFSIIGSILAFIAGPVLVYIKLLTITQFIIYMLLILLLGCIWIIVVLIKKLNNKNKEYEYIRQNRDSLVNIHEEILSKNDKLEQENFQLKMLLVNIMLNNSDYIPSKDQKQYIANLITRKDGINE